jgi:imidazole glycerol phosphate synthase glutamine amidotransferase subunit
VSISVLNYGAGNLRSITNLLDYNSLDYTIIKTREEIENADILILPGVGHFGQLMDYLEENNLKESLMNHIKTEKPYLGICLGLQILFQSSEEAPGKAGLGVFPGKVLKFTQGKVPQMGWNKLQVTSKDSMLTEEYVYFVNSYYVYTEKEDIIASRTNYYIDFVSGVQSKNLLAVQFHPEKSGKVGGKLVKRWLDHVS